MLAVRDFQERQRDVIFLTKSSGSKATVFILAIFIEIVSFDMIKMVAALSTLSVTKSPGAGAVHEKVVKFGVTAKFTTFSSISEK